MIKPTVSNRDSWDSDRVVTTYLKAKELQKPEQSIFKILQPRLKEMKMLDLGVGTGRTTAHFAPLVNSYVGMDYAENMLNACKSLFPDTTGKITFNLGDVRSMPEYKNNDFDFVFFSYNGLDYMGHEDRKRALHEIIRVLKKDGIFVFSTHNMRHISQLYKIRLLKNPKDFIYQFYHYLMLHYYNGFSRKYEKLPYAVLNDGTNQFGVTTYYIQPEEQTKRLEDLGFKNIRLFSTVSGKEITGQDYSKNKADCWIYYLCQLA